MRNLWHIQKCDIANCMHVDHVCTTYTMHIYHIISCLLLVVQFQGDLRNILISLIDVAQTLVCLGSPDDMDEARSMCNMFSASCHVKLTLVIAMYSGSTSKDACKFCL